MDKDKTIAAAELSVSPQGWEIVLRLAEAAMTMVPPEVDPAERTRFAASILAMAAGLKAAEKIMSNSEDTVAARASTVMAVLRIQSLTSDGPALPFITMCGAVASGLIKGITYAMRELSHARRH